MTIENRVLEWIYTKNGSTIRELRAKRRDRGSVFSRMIFCGIMREFDFSYPSIGKFLNRDHTTIIHSINRVEIDESLKSMVLIGYEEIRKKVEEDRVKLKDEYVASQLEPFIKHGQISKINRWSAVYEKYEGRCCVCGFSEVVEVHHIFPRSLGGGDHMDNLILLCPNHHALFERGLIFIKDIHKKFSDYTFPSNKEISLYKENH